MINDYKMPWGFCRFQAGQSVIGSKLQDLLKMMLVNQRMLHRDTKPSVGPTVWTISMWTSVMARERIGQSGNDDRVN